MQISCQFASDFFEKRLHYCTTIALQKSCDKPANRRAASDEKPTPDPHARDTSHLHWLKVRERIRHKILILTHKALYAHAPPYLCLLVVKKESVVSTRSSQDGYLLCKLPTSRDCSNTFLEHSFLYAAPHEWNSLEREVSECLNSMC